MKTIAVELKVPDGYAYDLTMLLSDLNAQSNWRGFEIAAALMTIDKGKMIKLHKEACPCIQCEVVNPENLECPSPDKCGTYFRWMGLGDLIERLPGEGDVTKCSA